MKSRYWYLLVFLFPLSAIFAFLEGGVASFATLFLLSIILPVAELFCGEDYVSPRAHKSESHHYYRAVLYGVAISQAILLVWGAYAVTNSNSFLESLGYVLAVGINGGIAFCAAHELIHKKERFDIGMGYLILICTATGHAPMEHVLVHHGPFITGTDMDHVHAKKGVNFYKFYLNAMLGLRTSAYVVEKKLLLRKGHHPLSLYNRLLSLNLCSLLLALFLGGVFGPQAIIYFIAAALVSSVIILGAAYIQHYGLERFVFADGSYEKFSDWHCWNSNYVLTNYLLFQLPRHSTHHMRPGRDYEVNEDKVENPQLPYGYFVCSLLIFVPYLWHKMMLKPIEENIETRKSQERLG